MTQADLLTLERRISAERFAPYRTACADDAARAIGLYERNLRLSAAFWEVLSDLEILVRNAMHDELTEWSLARFGDRAWYMDHGKVLDGEAADVMGGGSAGTSTNPCAAFTSSATASPITSPSTTVPLGYCTSGH